MVEDNPDCRRGMQLMLEDLGYRVFAAENGFEGLAAYERAGTVDLAIVDLILPGISGSSLISNLTFADSHVRVIATTGGSFADQRLQSARTRGAVTSLPKPFSRREFLNAVERAVR